MTTPPVPQWAVDLTNSLMDEFGGTTEDHATILRIIAAHAPQGNEDGARYQFVRRMSPREFTAIWRENVTTGVHFDALIDAARKKDL